jgi:outer membrane murein-binding lipoprotein Lpp
LSLNSFACKYCNKEYSSKQSRSNHYYLYHNKNDSKSKLEVSGQGKSSVSDKITYPCRFCTNIYLHKQSRYSHEKKCKETELKDVIILKEQNKELASQLTNANKFLKLNDEEFRGLVNLYTQTGKTVDDIKNSILGTAKAYKLQTGLQIDERKILGDVLKTSNAIKLSIKGGTEALVQATINANKFGTSLDQLDKTADSLLNFEQSISNELEAELLLGRDLNLERARAAALTNDTVALTEEVGRLVSSFGPDFEKNRIAQEAFANTLGISRQELADMYTTYQQNEKLAETQRKVGIKLTDKEIELLEKKGSVGAKLKEGLKAGTLTGVEFYDALKMAGFEGKKLTEALAGLSEQSLASQSAQEKFDDALEKAKETFTRFVDGESLDKFADFLAKFIESVGIKGLGSTLLTGLADDSDILQARAQEKVKQYQSITGNTSEDKAKKEKLGSEIKDLQSQLDKLNNEYIAEAKSGSFGFEQRKAAETLERSKRGESGIMYAGSGPKFADGGMIKKPVYNATIGEAGPEAVVPLNEFYAKLDKLIAVTQEGKNIYMDYEKVATVGKTKAYKSDYS